MGRLKFIAAMAISATLFTQTSFAGSDEEELEARLRQHDSKVQLFSTDKIDWKRVAKRLGDDAPKAKNLCVDQSFDRMSDKYAVSYGADGKPCRIYDLSFPTLEALFAKTPVSQLPVQSFGARDYLNWMDGDYEAVLGKISNFQSSFGRNQSIKLDRWVKKVEFKSQRLMSLQAKVPETGLPVSFRASDLEIGNRFHFNDSEKRRLKEALGILSTGPSAGTMGVLSSSDFVAWNRVIDQPQSLLAQIKFEWNDLDKVYDIFIEGEFLPLRGPIALVDYSASYKIAVERIMRSIVQSALGQLVRFVPGQAQQIVGLALNDGFRFIDMAYEYQMNQLESTLRANMTQNLSLHMSPQDTTRGLNILFGGKADLVEQYIMAAARGMKFNWDELEAAGRSVRYSHEKLRDISVNNQYSRLVTRNGCELVLINNYFGECTVDGKRQVFSLISETSILFWNLGAPQVYNYERSSEILLKRSASYLLSVGASLFNLPIISYFSGVLSDSLKTYAFAGITDEAFLKNELYLSKGSAGALDGAKDKMYSMFYLQNINPFLPKSEAQENRVIQKHLGLLGLAE